MAVTSKAKKTGIFFQTDAAVLALVESRLNNFEKEVSQFTGESSAKYTLDLEHFKIYGYLLALKDVDQLSYRDFQHFSSRLHKLEFQVNEIVFAAINKDFRAASC